VTEQSTTRRTALRAVGATVTSSLLVGCLNGASGTGSIAETTFDDGTSDWSLVDMTTYDRSDDPDWSEVQGTLDLTWEESGGVEDTGYVKHLDNTDYAFFFDAPSEYLGDVSAAAGGQLAFSQRSSHTGLDRNAAVVLEGPDRVVTTQFDPPAQEWTQYTLTLDADTRDFHERNVGGPTVDQPAVESVLSDFQALRIGGEHNAGVSEEVGFDEVRLSES